jgi:hypothetical protein
VRRPIGDLDYTDRFVAVFHVDDRDRKSMNAVNKIPVLLDKCRKFVIAVAEGHPLFGPIQTVTR